MCVPAQVDCFSFGMFLYELISLHPPFEGYESVKEHILEGRRPPLTVKVLSGAEPTVGRAAQRV